MYREAINELKKWKERKIRKPLIIKGARQIGKTWLMREFATQYYSNCIYITFDSNKRIARVFEPDLNPRRIIAEIEDIFQQKINPEKTLLIFDEIQELQPALSSLKYFYEEAPEYNIVCAGSFLGISLHEGTSFPVGKVDFLNLYPLSYSEFLMAIGKDELAQKVDSFNTDAFRLFSDEYSDALKKYFYLGGMPEVVNTYIETGSYDEARTIQRNIITMYDQDFSKHAPTTHLPRIRALFKSIPEQLGKENKKFKYSDIAKSARAREYEIALMWLIDTGLAYKVNRVSEIRHPLKPYADDKAFKLYGLDVGLIACMSGLDRDTLFYGSEVFIEFKGALAEQFVLTELISVAGLEPFYWGNDSGRAEVDFIVQKDNNIVPIEVKSGKNTSAKSLIIYRNKFNPKLAIRASQNEYTYADGLMNIPLYSIGSFSNLEMK